MYGLGWLLGVRSGFILVVLVSTVVLPKFPVSAPEGGPLSRPRPEARSLVDLYRLRDRLRTDLEAHPTVMVSARSGIGTAPKATLDQLWAIDHQLIQEERARWLHQRAEQAAAAATALGDPSTLPTAALARAIGHWEEARAALDQMPADTWVATQVSGQRQEYERQWAIAAYHYDIARSDFLGPLVESTGMAQRVRLTVCTLQRDCRRWQGDRPPASPASLIKVPVAIALMTHLHQVGIDPGEPIWVDPGNWTEDAGTTWVRTEYPLEQIMADMVSASSNIATNQLIDYLGWEGVNHPLRRKGYRTTRISKKLVGESTYPTNPGTVPNAITTDELTDMMVAIYNREIPQAELIQAALADQRDRNLGHAVVAPPITWLGEKTGRNSKVLGTTVAIGLGDQRYIITATLDHSANEAAMRSLLAGVIKHLLTHDGFGQTADPAATSAPRPQTFLP